MAQEMRTQMIQSMKAHAEGHIQKHKANVEIYLNQPVGIGEHGDVLETIEKELNINPFLRSSIEEVRKSAEIYSSKANLDDVGVLAVIRSWKDNF